MKKFNKIKTIISIIGIIAVIILFCLQFYWILNLNNKFNVLSERIYNIEKTQNKEKYAHLSIDDTINIFEDLYKNENQYYTIFQNSTLKYLQDLHNTYGIVVSCYCWYEDNGFNLSMLSNKYAKEFNKNSDWLRFGFHAYDRNTTYENGEVDKISEEYSKTINELIRITGGKESIDNIVRLHCYAGSKECIDAIKNIENGITGLLTADTEGRLSYYFNQEDSNYIFTHDYYMDNGLIFINTDFRMENYENIQVELDMYSKNNSNNTGILEFFTHEWKINNTKVKDNIEKCCYYAIINEYSWDFPEDRI